MWHRLSVLRSMEELLAGLSAVEAAPADEGGLELIVRRPRAGEREVVETAELDLVEGLAGDNWKARGSKRTKDGSAHPDMQLNVMSARAAALFAGTRDRWALAGDQLYVDLDLSVQNLSAGVRLAIGDAVVEVTAVPHTGCKKFLERFGRDALKLVNSDRGKALRLRGLNAKVVRAGVIRVGDVAKKVGDD